MPAFDLSSWAERTAWVLFVAAFLGTCAVALMVQLLLLPYYLPQLHAGHGVLVGGGSAGMYASAAALGERKDGRCRSFGKLVRQPLSFRRQFTFLTPAPFRLLPLKPWHKQPGAWLFTINDPLLCVFVSRNVILLATLSA